MSGVNVSNNFKVSYCKYVLKCRHKHIKKECEERACNKKCNKRHIKSHRYGSRCKWKKLCQFKHYITDNNDKVILQEKIEVETLKKEVAELKKKLAESKMLLEDTTL